MVKRYTTVLVVLVLCTINVLKSQDAIFSQFYANPLYLNPALAGSEHCPRVGLNYRNQWPGLEKGFVTYNLSYDQYVRFLQGGIGLNLVHDVQNACLKTTIINAMYSYTLQMATNFYLAGGFQASYMMKRIDWDFVFQDMLHPLYGPIYVSSENRDMSNPYRNHFDFSLGFIGYSQKTFLGLAVHHLTQPNESFSKNASDATLKLKLTAHFGTEFEINPPGSKIKRGDLKVAPQLIYQQQGEFQQFNWGLYLIRKEFSAGIWARQNFDFQYDAITMMLGYRQENFRIGYSYDFTVSRLSRATMGAHELSFAFIFGCTEKASKRKAIRCPMF